MQQGWERFGSVCRQLEIFKFKIIFDFIEIYSSLTIKDSLFHIKCYSVQGNSIYCSCLQWHITTIAKPTYQATDNWVRKVFVISFCTGILRPTSTNEKLLMKRITVCVCFCGNPLKSDALVCFVVRFLTQMRWKGFLLASLRYDTSEEMCIAL